MAQPQPSTRAQVPDLKAWHQRVLADHPIANADESISDLYPSKLWQLVATDLLLANIDSPLWGWSNADSLWLLDFWLELEPELYVILTTVSPQRWLAETLGDPQALPPQQALANWHRVHQQILRQHLRNPRRTVLVDAQQVLSVPEALTEYCEKHWGPGLDARNLKPVTADAPDALRYFFAGHLCAQSADVLSLQRELESSYSLLADSEADVLSAQGPVEALRGSAFSGDALSAALVALNTQQVEGKNLAKENEKLQKDLLQSQQALDTLQSQFTQASKEKSDLLEQLAAMREANQAEVKKLLSGHEQQAKKINEVSSQLISMKREIAQRDAQLKEAEDKSAEMAQLKPQLIEAREENELLLQQLHQVQEELEAHFLKNRDLEQERTKLSQERSQLANQVKEREAQAAKLKAERDRNAAGLKESLAKIAQLENLRPQLEQVQKKLEQAFLKGQESEAKLLQASKTLAERDQQLKDAETKETELNALKPQLIDVQEENELLLQQLHQVQEELESIFLKSRDHEQQSATLSQAQAQLAEQVKQRESQVTKLSQERDQLAKQVKERDEQLKSQQKKISALEPLSLRLQSAQDENKLLFDHLHEVQQKLEQQLESSQLVNKRWEQLILSQPDVFLASELTVEAKPLSFAQQAIHWSFSKVTTANRDIDQLRVASFFNNEGPGLAILRDPETSPLLNWPKLAEEAAYCIIISPDHSLNSEESEATLLDLSTSDWLMLKGVLRAMLAKRPVAMRSLDAQPELVDRLESDLVALARTLEEQPSVLRFDCVELVSDYVEREYEHLWLRLDNLSFAERQWPSFEFRFACAGDLAHQFGVHPRLEFPAETGQAPFEKWFVESQNRFGDKLELRYGPPDKMDIGIWRKLSPADQEFISSLIGLLPRLLTAIESSNRTSARPLDEWIELARQVNKTHAHLLGSRPARQTRLQASDQRPESGFLPSFKAQQESSANEPTGISISDWSSTVGAI
ncbi:hypothetical protein [Halochromatium roseum]|uniref:hypothetical protein n=1 Tax=Halochromatium roseum TaxID=391920 RepID=UPI001913519B|nr:hypothetical protein [Halochromatium roseum]